MDFEFFTYADVLQHIGKTRHYIVGDQIMTIGPKFPNQTNIYGIGKVIMMKNREWVGSRTQICCICGMKRECMQLYDRHTTDILVTCACDGCRFKIDNAIIRHSWMIFDGYIIMLNGLNDIHVINKRIFSVDWRKYITPTYNDELENEIAYRVLHKYWLISQYGCRDIAMYIFHLYAQK